MKDKTGKTYVYIQRSVHLTESAGDSFVLDGSESNVEDVLYYTTLSDLAKRIIAEVDPLSDYALTHLNLRIRINPKMDDCEILRDKDKLTLYEYAELNSEQKESLTELLKNKLIEVNWRRED